MTFERIAPEQHDTLEGIAEPAETSFLLGHDDVARTIATAYRSGKLPHALLLAGPRGIGKATLAFHVAYHLLHYPTPADASETLAAPNPTSPLFRQIAMGAHPSVLHLTRAFDDKKKKFKTQLTVDEIRRVSRFMTMTSHDGSYRVVIVDPADDMNINAANALLKNLEEPPARTLFMLITHSQGSLLPTIRSRCQMLRMQPLATTDVEAVLKRLELTLPATDSGLMERAGGSVRDAILLSHFGGLEIANGVDELIAAGSFDVAKAHRLADAVSGRDNEIHFDLMNAHLLEVIAAAADTAAAGGDLRRAGVMAERWQEIRIAIDDTETYNLDRKQHTLNMLNRLHETLRM